MKGKGQWTSLEQMTLFLIGVVIMALVYSSFTDLSQKTTKTVSDDQLKGVTEVILSGIYKAYNLHGNEVTESKMAAEIPKEISGEAYSIMVEGNEIRIVTETKTVSRNIGAVGGDIDLRLQEEFRQGLSSRKGSVEISLRGNEIIIGR